MGTESEGLTRKICNQTELRHSTFSQVESAVVTFEERKGEQSPETDFSKCCQVLEEGDNFESPFWRLDRCFLAFMRVDAHLLWNFWNALRLLSVGLAF